MSNIPDTKAPGPEWANAWSSEDLGRHIAALRQAKGLRQEDFAAQLGVSRTTLSALENGGSVSLRLATKAISWLGSRMVILPKDAQVSVKLRE